MSKYIIKFSKVGYIKYSSHLDMVRLFKRLFNRAGIHLEYSQGFNPHPKMCFAQPLSLGYSSLEEILEIETKKDFEPEEIKEVLNDLLPEGIKVLAVERDLSNSKVTLAAKTVAASYLIEIPILNGIKDYLLISEKMMSESEIIVEKINRKKGTVVQQNIRPMIRKLELQQVDHKIIMEILVDQGSTSNLSPELVISALETYSNSKFERSNIEVTRKKIICNL